MTWGSCDVENDDYIIDQSQTYVTPEVIVKDAALSFNIGGIVQYDTTFDRITVKVTWDGNPLYKQDFPRETSVKG